MQLPPLKNANLDRHVCGPNNVLRYRGDFFTANIFPVILERGYSMGWCIKRSAIDQPTFHVLCLRLAPPMTSTSGEY